MRKVIPNQPVDGVQLSQINSNGLFAIEWEGRLWIPTRECSGKYIARPTNSSCGGLNGSFGTVHELLQECLAKGYPVLEFSTVNELASFIVANNLK